MREIKGRNTELHWDGSSVPAFIFHVLMFFDPKGVCVRQQTSLM